MGHPFFVFLVKPSRASQGTGLLGRCHGMRSSPWLRPRQASRSDDGFTLVELTVAMVITLGLLSTLLSVFVSSLSTVTQAKQRQAATALATQVIEQLRALPYDTVTKPAAVALPSGDPNVQYVSPPRFKPAVRPEVDEVLVVNTVSPKTTTSTLDNVPFTVRQYVGKAAAAGTEQPYTLTVIVSWTSRVSNGVKTTVERSAVYSPSGCLSTSTRPFSGPCQAYFTAQAGQTGAGVTISNPVDSSAPIPGFNGRQVALGLPLLSAGMLLEQTTNASASVSTGEGFVRKDELVERSGGLPANAAVDSDPSSSAGQSATSNTPTQTAGAQSLVGSAGALRAAPGTTDSGSVGAAVAAEPAQCSGGDAAATPLTTGPATSRRPCATAVTRAAGAAAYVSYELPASFGLGAQPSSVVSLGASPAAARATSAHLITGNATACPGTSGAGCAHASAHRALGDLAVGGLPASGAPAGFSGSWKVTGLTESVRSERGVAAAAPSYSRAGTLTWWTGAGYSAPVALSPSLYQDITVPTASWTAEAGTPSREVIRIEVSSTIKIRPVQAPPPTGPVGCKTSACVASIGAAGGVSGSTTYVVSVDGVEVTRFVVVTDLGGLLAETAYRAAPDA